MLGDFSVGDIVEGKVTGVKPFGAFVAIDDKNQGLVHISEVAHGYVKDINDFLSVGDEVKVKILTIDEDSGRVSLSIRATQPKPQSKGGGGKGGRGKEQRGTLEDKLKDWMKESNEKQEQLNKRLKK